MSTRPRVILGAGRAAAEAAVALQAARPDDPLVMVAEGSRPPFCPDGGRDGGFYRRAGIELRLGVAAEAIDLDAARVRLSDGTALPYAQLLIATGCQPRRLPETEAAGAPVRRLSDETAMQSLLGELRAGQRLVIVGGGATGMEVAAGARELGCEVSVIEAGRDVMAGRLSAPVATHLAQVHRDRGVELLLGQSPAGVSVRDGAAELVLESGRRLGADLIVVAAGAVPNLGLAAAAGIAVADGILVDRLCATSAEGVFAAGDVTFQYQRFARRRVRIDGWDHAVGQGRAAALNMLGAERPYTHVATFRTCQYGLHLAAAGAVAGDLAVVRRAGGRELAVFHLREGVLVGYSAVEPAEELALARSLIAAEAEMDPVRLADPAIPVLAARARAGAMNSHSWGG